MFNSLDLNWPSMNPNENDARYLDYTLHFSLSGDTIPSRDAIATQVARKDGFPLATDDLNVQFVTLDDTGLIVTVWIFAPPASAGNLYRISVIVNPTMQKKTLIRNVFLQVAPWHGIAAATPPWQAQVTIAPELFFVDTECDLILDSAPIGSAVVATVSTDADVI